MKCCAPQLLLKTASLALVAIGFVHAQQCDTSAVFSAPLQINKGGTYTGNWQSSDPSVPAVFINTPEPVTIIGSRLKGPGDLIHYYLNPTGEATAASALTVQQSCFVGANPNVAGSHKGTPIWVQNAVSVRVENCDFESGGLYGIWVQGYVGDHTPANTVTIRYNRIHNVDGRASDGKGGYLTSNRQFAHAIHLSEVHGVPGIEIAWNQVINEPYQSSTDDSINVYNSVGTASSPIQIHDNYIQGGYEPDPTAANSDDYGGAGITTDGNFQTDPGIATGFLKIHDNQTVSESRGGVNISVGHDIEIFANRVVSHGQLADGTNYSLANASGINQANYVNDPPVAFGNNIFHDNLSGMRRIDSKGNPGRLDYYWTVPPAADVNDASWSPATGATPTLVDEANELLLWNEKLITQRIMIGSALIASVPNGSVQLVNGNNQVAAPKSTTAAPLVARIVNPAGVPIAGASVSFLVATANATVSQHFAVSDSNGVVTTGLLLGTAPAEVQVNVIVVGFTGASFTAWITQPAPVVSGVAGAGGSVPPVQSLSQSQLVSIYGLNFLPPGVAGRRVMTSEFINGGLPTALLGVCVDVGGQRAAMLDVFPNQINAQIPALTDSSVNVRVLTYCGTPVETASTPQNLAVSAAYKSCTIS